MNTRLFTYTPHSVDSALLKPIYQSSFYKKIGDSICRYLITPENSSALSSNDTWGWNRLLDKFGAGECVPNQWINYQLFIAQIKRAYYLDVPNRYDQLNNSFPRIHVKKFGEFFFEWEDLLD